MIAKHNQEIPKINVENPDEDAPKIGRPKLAKRAMRFPSDFEKLKKY